MAWTEESRQSGDSDRPQRGAGAPDTHCRAGRPPARPPARPPVLTPAPRRSSCCPLGQPSAPDPSVPDATWGLGLSPPPSPRTHLPAASSQQPFSRGFRGNGGLHLCQQLPVRAASARHGCGGVPRWEQRLVPPRSRCLLGTHWLQRRPSRLLSARSRLGGPPAVPAPRGSDGRVSPSVPTLQSCSNAVAAGSLARPRGGAPLPPRRGPCGAAESPATAAGGHGRSLPAHGPMSQREKLRPQMSKGPPSRSMAGPVSRARCGRRAHSSCRVPRSQSSHTLRALAVTALPGSEGTLGTPGSILPGHTKLTGDHDTGFLKNSCCSELPL